MTYATLTTDQLAAGDIVHVCGATFRLTTVKSYTTDYGTCYAWATEVVESLNWSGPKHWLRDWKIQGNHRAFWRVEVPA
jgi:hypothetical protein